jgi:trk system potassium uptake protein TrkA
MSSSQNKYAVIGLGQFGMAIAKALSAKGAEVLAIDHDEDHVNQIADQVAFAVALDATDKKALQTQNVQDSDAVVVAIGENFEALLLCTVILMEIKVKRIIARANDDTQRVILEKIGVTEILSPELEVGNIVAERLLNPSLLSFLHLPDDYEIAELKTPVKIAGRSLGDIGFRNKYKLNLITFEREQEIMHNGEVMKEKHIVGVPHSESVLYENDTIIVFGKTKDVERFVEVNK